VIQHGSPGDVKEKTLEQHIETFIKRTILSKRDTSSSGMFAHFLHAGVDKMFLISQVVAYYTTNIVTSVQDILQEAQKLDEIKWWLISNDSTGLPVDVLTIIGNYLPWFKRVTIDPERLRLLTCVKTLEQQLLKRSSEEEIVKNKKRRLN